MRLFQFLSLGAVVTLALNFGPAAHATPIITAGSTTAVAQFGTAPGSASSYDFSDFGRNQPVNLTDVTFSVGGGMQFSGNSNYSSVTAPGGSSSFLTGVQYFSNGNTDSFGTFTTTLSSFTINMLTGNADPVGFVLDSSVGLSVDGGAIVSVEIPSTATTNDFTSFTVTGVTPSDTFTIYATGTGAGDETNMGGITFGPADLPSVPEPSSIALLGTGILGMAGVVRRRFRA